MSAPPVYGQPQNGQQGYGPPQYQPPQNYGPPVGPPPSAQPLGSPSQQSDDASGFFTGASGAPALSFPKGEFGVWKGGIFTGQIKTKQATTMKTETKPSTPRFWDSGDEVLDVVVEILSQDRDPSNPLDDGRRRMFVTQENTHIADSKASVTREATSNGFHRGGQIYWCRVNQRMGKQNMRDVWECRYVPPTAETLAVLDNLPPQGVSQQAANQVQASQQEQSPFVGQQQGPPPQYQQGPPQYAPAAQQGPPPQNGQQGYGPPAQQYQQGPPPQYQQGPPAQTHNPYGQPAQGNPYQQ